MVAGTLEVGGKQYVLIPVREYERLRREAGRKARGASREAAPEMPGKLANGNYPAVESLRAGLARKLVKRRLGVGMSQAIVAARAGISIGKLERIEKGEITPSTAVVTKIVAVLERAGDKSGGMQR